MGLWKRVAAPSWMERLLVFLITQEVTLQTTISAAWYSRRPAASTPPEN
jgi:hypothetical protein